MNLVILDDALGRVVKITNILKSPRGSFLSVGVGGSDKKSFTKLASFFRKHVFFETALINICGESHCKDKIKNL